MKIILYLSDYIIPLTIFYIVGAVLAVGAGVLLVTKKKMGADEE